MLQGLKIWWGVRTHPLPASLLPTSLIEGCAVSSFKFNFLKVSYFFHISAYIHLPVSGNYESLSKKTILANKYIFDRFDGKFDFVLKVCKYDINERNKCFST